MIGTAGFYGIIALVGVAALARAISLVESGRGNEGIPFIFVGVVGVMFGGVGWAAF